MTLEQLRYFYEAAKFQHVGKAAQFVHISPSSISSAISAIEEEIGAPLFDRVGKSISLTETGKRLQTESAHLLDQFQSLKLRVTGSDEDLRGHYRLGGSHFLATHVLTDSWNRLQEDYPKLVGEISSLPTAQVISEVVSGQLDFGLCFSPFRHPEVAIEELHQGQLVLAVKNQHPLLQKSAGEAFKALADFPAVIHKGRPGVDLCEDHPIFDQYGIEPDVKFLFDNDDCAIQKVTRSEAWTMLPDVIVEHFSKKMKQINLPKQWSAPYTIALIFRKDRGSPVILKKLLESLKLTLKSS